MRTPALAGKNLLRTNLRRLTAPAPASGAGAGAGAVKAVRVALTPPQRAVRVVAGAGAGTVPEQKRTTTPRTMSRKQQPMVNVLRGTSSG